MLKISKLSDYGAVVLSLLARYPEQRFSASQVAEQTHLPMPTASKLLKLLHEARLVVSTRGTHGGYQLMRAPELISVAEIIAAIEGELTLTECSKSVEACDRSQFCELKHNWRSINHMISSLLQQLSLADMSSRLNKVLLVQNVEEASYEKAG